jgi:transcriptional regulator with XRE-family HTH domain
MKPIHSKLRAVRTTKGYSQEYMADTLGISQRQYSRLENGQSEITLKYLDKICKELEIEPKELFANEIKQENSNQSGGNANAAYVIINEMSEKLIEQYELRLKEKDETIALLKTEIQHILPV